MKNRNENGFGAVELLIGLVVAAMIGLGTTMLTQQTLTVNDRTHTNIATTTQVENAGYWISRDAQMSEDILTAGLDSQTFIEFGWTEWLLGQDSIYHSVIYSFANTEDGVGDLMRTHWSSAGENQTTLVAKYIYFDPEDTDGSSLADFANGYLNIRLVSILGHDTAIRNTKVSPRPGFAW
ncbi:MAG: hypothetical protein PHE50_00445 [Dehalococcoidales bacterium]|nr:hypothetical protein [Dehalococcoidales bacterium]